MAQALLGPAVYLLVEREFRRLPLAQRVYKIGRTDDVVERMRGYPNGSEVLLTIRVDDAKTAEARVLQAFDALYQRQSDIGRKYYSGASVDQMARTLVAEVLPMMSPGTPFVACAPVQDDAATDDDHATRHSDSDPDSDSEYESDRGGAAGSAATDDNDGVRLTCTSAVARVARQPLVRT
jgi:hypothetical protein